MEFNRRDNPHRDFKFNPPLNKLMNARRPLASEPKIMPHNNAFGLELFQQDVTKKLKGAKLRQLLIKIQKQNVINTIRLDQIFFFKRNGEKGWRMRRV